MQTRKPTAADGYDTWDAGWEERLASHVRSAGHGGMWDYVRRYPGRSYGELAERLSAEGGFGVAPIQIERLQVHDTPDPELRLALRDSLARHIRHAFEAQRWGQGPYWESRAIGALAAWSGMWSARVDVAPMKHRLFEAGAPEGWLPADGGDPFLITAVPDVDPAAAEA